MKITIEVTDEEVQEFTSILVDTLEYYSTLDQDKETNFKRLYLITSLSKRIAEAHSQQIDLSIKNMGL